MKIKIMFPTRSRPEKFLEVYGKYQTMLDDPKNVEFCINCDTDDETMADLDVRKKILAYKNVCLNYNPNKSKIEACNVNVRYSDFDILILASDDMVPVKSKYDYWIRKGFEKLYPDLDGVLHFNDGVQQSRLNTFCILGKKYYDRFNYIYHPDYKSLYCDQEFTDVSYKLDKATYIDNIIIRHEHHAHGYCENDALYKKNEQYCSEDQQTYIRRKKNNFDL